MMQNEYKLTNNHFLMLKHCDLALWHKSKDLFFLRLKSMHKFSDRKEMQKANYDAGKSFQILEHNELDLWLFDLKLIEIIDYSVQLHV